MITPEETAELERLLADATPAGWAIFRSAVGICPSLVSAEGSVLAEVCGPNRHNDIALIVFLRNHAAALLAAARQAEVKDARIAELEAVKENLLKLARFVWRWCNRPNMTDPERVDVIRNHPFLSRYVEPPDDAYRRGDHLSAARLTDLSPNAGGGGA